jgi:hypothetical protein
MYHPGRQFLENLYLWLLQFSEQERLQAIRFAREELIFVSRVEFEQLAQILYHDKIHRHQLQVAASMSGLAPFRVRAARESPAFKRVARASLYVGMSDGARIDYIRRHNLDINNEQVVPYYRVASEKISELVRDLGSAVADSSARFRCLFLMDDFCGSGKTLLRELVIAQIEGPCQARIAAAWKSRLTFNQQKNALELIFQGELGDTDKRELLQMGEGANYAKAVDALLAKSKQRESELKGSLVRVAKDLDGALDEEATVCFCPLLITEQAFERLSGLTQRLPGKFARTAILPGAILSRHIQITTPAHPVGNLCEKYYRPEELEDEHTGSVKYGLENCGLPVVLHHNTPNNSIFLLWARKSDRFSPLFVRYERHGREGA